MEFLIHTVLKSGSFAGIKVYSDNNSVVKGWWSGRNLSSPRPSGPGEKKRTLTWMYIQTAKPKHPCLLNVLNNPSSSSTITFRPSTSFNPTLSSLLPSVLCPPDCPAGDCIHVWRPMNTCHTLNHNNLPTNFNENDLAYIKNLLEHTFAPNTRNSYGSGLLIFHIFCNLRGINKEHHAPVNLTVLSTFISTLTGSYRGSTIKNYIYRIHSWHILHGIKWFSHDNKIKALLKAANKLAPRSSQQKKKPPWMIHHLTTFCKVLNQNIPKDSAILPCLTTTFWGTTHLREVTVPKLNGFNPNLHIKPLDVQHNVKDRNNCEETIIFLPWTKTAQEKGKSIFWAKQDGPVDPQHTLQNYFKINSLKENDHLFSFKHADSYCPMTQSIFIAQINQIITKFSLPQDLTGHGIHVSSTLEYLLQGISFNIVKDKGRWQSNTFHSYLHDHTQVMVPYMQAKLIIHDSIVCYSMPLDC